MILKEEKNILPINHRELEFQYIDNKANHKIVIFNIVVALQTCHNKCNFSNCSLSKSSLSHKEEILLGETQ